MLNLRKNLRLLEEVVISAAYVCVPSCLHSDWKCVITILEQKYSVLASECVGRFLGEDTYEKKMTKFSTKLLLKQLFKKRPRLKN